MKPDRIINGKPIYIVENHASAVEGWWDVRNRLGMAPALLTLDLHTDTLPAFNKAIFADHPGMDTIHRAYDLSWEYCRKADLSTADSLHAAIARLKHDEHIDAAIKMRIVNHAYVISHQEGSPTRRKTKASGLEIRAFLETHSPEEYYNCPFTPFDLPDNRIFELLPTCPPWCQAEHHDGDECLKLRSDCAIEADFLEWKLEEIGEMSACLGIKEITAEPFIFDVDLDYFHTWKGIEPNDPKTFYHLVQRSHAITIATEPGCVMGCRLDGEDHTADSLLKRLHEHLEAALS